MVAPERARLFRSGLACALDAGVQVRSAPARTAATCASVSISEPERQVRGLSTLPRALLVGMLTWLLWITDTETETYA